MAGQPSCSNIRSPQRILKNQFLIRDIFNSLTPNKCFLSLLWKHPTTNFVSTFFFFLFFFLSAGWPSNRCFCSLFPAHQLPPEVWFSHVHPVQKHCNASKASPSRMTMPDASDGWQDTFFVTSCTLLPHAVLKPEQANHGHASLLPDDPPFQQFLNAGYLTTSSEKHSSPKPEEAVTDLLPKAKWTLLAALLVTLQCSLPVSF